jgi:hypothetical protein
MDKPQEPTLNRSIRRRLSAIKVAVRVIQDELDMSGEGRITIERSLAEDLATSLEVFSEDLERDAGIVRQAPMPTQGVNNRQTISADKPVARMN